MIIIGGTFIGLVAYSYYLVHNAAVCARYLHREDLWSAWKREEGYDVLLSIEPKCLSSHLINDIEIEYCDEQNPVKCFLEDIKEEYDILLQWLQFRNVTDMLRLSAGSNFYLIEKRLALLELMRKSIKYWRAQQLSSKMAQSL